MNIQMFKTIIMGIWSSQIRQINASFSSQRPRFRYSTAHIVYVLNKVSRATFFSLSISVFPINHQSTYATYSATHHKHCLACAIDLTSEHIIANSVLRSLTMKWRFIKPSTKKLTFNIRLNSNGHYLIHFPPYLLVKA